MRFKHLVIIMATFSASVLHGQTAAGNYRIAIVDGEGALNNLANKSSKEPVIQVSDVAHKPVSGAYVEFDTPGSGAGAGFANGSTHFATTTNSDGLAVGSNLHNNGIAGAFLISVRVSFKGLSIGEIQIHQTNLSSAVSHHLQQGSTSGGTSGDVPGNVTLPNSVVGIALGEQFLVNGAPTPSNANLLTSTRIQTLDKAVSLYLHDRCEYLVGPHSAIVVNPKQVTLETGSVRAKRFGNCRILYSGLWVTGAPDADGVAALTGQNLDVASVAGNVQVVNSAGDVISTVTPGNVSSFGTSSVASGATIGGAGGNGIPFKTALLLGSSVVGALAGLGLATDAILQPSGSGTPTSP